MGWKLITNNCHVRKVITIELLIDYPKMKFTKNPLDAVIREISSYKV